MLRPRKMSRVLIAGSARYLGRAVEALHGSRTLHITDYVEQYEGFKLGRPLEGAAGHSEKLLKLRSAAKTLGIEAGLPPQKKKGSKWARDRLDGLLGLLETEVNAKDEKKQALTDSLRELERRKEAVLPFARLTLPFECYQPYERLAVFTGTVKAPLEPDISKITGKYELLCTKDGLFIALFVAREFETETEKLLSRKGFTEVRAPPEMGNPAALLAKLTSDIGASRNWLRDLDVEIAAARESHMEDILACSEELSVGIQKAEAPLRFAATSESFVIEGWIPASEVDRTENALLKATGNHIYMERIEEREWLAEAAAGTKPAKGLDGEAPAGAKMENGEGVGARASSVGEAGGKTAGEKGPVEKVKAKALAKGSGKMGGASHAEHADVELYDKVPIALSNRGPVKPFEFLTKMYSMPSYKEIDPTGVLALVFPLFFGLMIGDMGYGALLMLTGIIFRTKLKRYEGFPEMGWYILTAGFVAFMLGMFIFGDAFGIPFHAPEHVEEASWSTLLGVDIPLTSSVHKLATSGLATLMVFSVLAGITHLSLGNIFGAINAWGHNRRHSVGKLGWLLVVLGFGFLILKVGEKTSLGAWLWGGVLAPFSPSLDTGVGILIPYASVVFLLAGVVMALVGEGGMAVLEVVGVVSNILSYTRLAAIAIAKAAMAFAFNSVLIPMALGGDMGLAAIGWILLIMAQFLVFVLGALSSGVQALRLNLVEFFMKFYRGGGTEFSPFGHVRKFTTEQGE